MNREKINLQSLRNIKLRTLKAETNKINQILSYISTNSITELNELIYAGAKLVCKKTVKTRMGNATGNADKNNIRKKAKMVKKKKKILEYVVRGWRRQHEEK